MKLLYITNVGVHLKRLVVWLIPMLTSVMMKLVVVAAIKKFLIETRYDLGYLDYFKAVVFDQMMHHYGKSVWESCKLVAFVVLLNYLQRLNTKVLCRKH